MNLHIQEQLCVHIVEEVGLIHMKMLKNVINVMDKEL